MPVAAPRGSAGIARTLRAWTALVVAATSAAALTLAGCANSGGIAGVATPSSAESVGLVASGPTVPLVAADWWRAYGDAQLSALIERALAEHPSLRLAQARIERAQALAGVVEATAAPQVSATAEATRQHFSANSVYPPPLGGSVRTLANAQLGASWEIDFFGRNRAALQAAVGSTRAAQAEGQAARSALAAGVARSYVQLARLQAQRRVAERGLQQRDEVLALVRQRVKAGIDSAVELRQSEAALPEMRQQIESLDEQIALARHALAALTAQPTQALDPLSAPLAATPGPFVPASVPADLLARRADITAARWRIEAAGSEVQAARAAFYPSINLAAFAGLSSIGLDRLLHSGSEQYGAGPVLRLPIFDAGRLRASLKGRTAELDAAVESYNAAVLDAVHEVADPISSLRAIERQQAEQALAQDAAESAHDLATQRYRAGLSSYLTVLNAEAAVLGQRRQAVDLRARAWDTQIALLRALGGGFASDAGPASGAGR